MNLENKDFNKMTLEELRSIEPFGKDETFMSVIIVPTDDLHESGFRCMKFIFVDGFKIVGCIDRGSDVVHPNGIGNSGKPYDISMMANGVVPYMGLSIDCLAGSGCARVMMGRRCKCDDFVGSDFQFFICGRS